MKTHPEQLWTVEQVANYCQVKPSIVRYWVQQREIPHLKLGKFLRFDPEEVREWVDLCKNGDKCQYTRPMLREIE